jgi:predicted phosphodiesterase
MAKRISADDLLARFSELVDRYSIADSVEYDNLKVENKPSRPVLRSRFGRWKDCLVAARKYRKNEPVKIAGESETKIDPDTHPEIQKLKQQVADLTRHIQTPSLHLDGVVQTFGVIGDTHLGSLYADLALLEYAYEVFADEKIKTVFHAGDILEGENMYKGQPYELAVHGADAQVDFCCERYPRKEGITTYFIDGNHDRSFWKRSGVCTGTRISQKRDDLVFLGHQESDVVVGEGECKAKVRLFHGEDGSSSYAISYRPQRYIAELPSGTKPDVLLMGHYHKAEILFYRGVTAFQTGCLQKQTPFMRGRRISAALGFWVVRIVVGPNRVVKVRAEFYPVRT